jgi:N-acetylglucosamine kinase-like BadF-type ATPase
MLDLLLGIDGGGSKTRALLADRTGNVLGVGTAASSNYQSVGFAAATTAVLQATNAALEQAGLHAPTEVAAACLGLAGVDRQADRVMWERWIREQGLAQRFVVVNDAELVLAAGTPEGWGVALICGTGSICYGRASDGRTARAGGWGYLLGDEGSGYDLALQALRLATQTADGRAEAHTILHAVLDHWKLSEPSQLIGHVYRPDVTHADIAQLARLIMDLAQADDRYACGIVDRAARDLAQLVRAVMRILDLQHAPIAFGGGLIGGSPGLQRAFIEQVDRPLQLCTFVDDAARGALVLAERLRAEL